MTTANICKSCGAEIPAGALHSLCPECLLRAAVDEETAVLEPGIADSSDPWTTIDSPDDPARYSASDDLSITEEQAGRYSAISEYARGGMGKVLLVHDSHLGRNVALKELLPPSQSSPDKPSPVRMSVPHVARFLQEARIAGQLEHPSIVPVYELGHRTDGTPYYTMKLVRGRTLAQALNEAKTLKDRLALLPHFIDLCQAIAYAHSRGVIHRDLKPSNVMVGEFGETVVLDWGLAKAKSEKDAHADGMSETLDAIKLGDPAKTAYGEVMGTPSYMPPEQAQGQIGQVDERSDIYSLGAVLYHLLTGQAPHEGKTAREVVQLAVAGQPKPIAELEPDAPPELRAVCERAVRPSPKDRYQTAKLLAEDVQRYQTGALVEAYEYKVTEYARRYMARHRGILVTSLVAAILLSAVIGYALVRVTRERDVAIQEFNRAELEREAAQHSAYVTDINLASQFLKTGQVLHANEALWKTPVEQRSWEWGYLLSQSNLATMGIYAGLAAFSPDGRYAAFEGINDNTGIRVIDVASREDVSTLVPETYRDSSSELVPDSELDPETYRDSSSDRPTLISLAWRDQYLILGFQDGFLQIVEPLTGDPVESIQGPSQGLLSYAYDASSSRILFITADAAFVWDADAKDTVARLEGFQAPMKPRSLRFSPDGRWIVGLSKTSNGQVWESSSGRKVATIGGADTDLASARFSADSKRLLTMSTVEYVHLASRSSFARCR